MTYIVNPNNHSGAMIITGGSRGIGAATAELAAKNGFSVCIGYLNRSESAESVAHGIIESGGNAIAVKVNTRDKDSVERMFSVSDEKLGNLVALVNNAGVLGGCYRVADLDLAILRETLDTNIMGYFLCAQQALRRMEIAHGGSGGTIVNVASVAARNGSAGERVHYAASKGAIVSFTKGLGLESIRQGVRVNAVSPGLTDTELNPPGRLEKLADKVPAGRVAAPSEIAEAIIWLSCPVSSYVVGENLTVSGGR